MSTQEKFLAAVNIIENLPNDGTFQPSEDLMLKLYAYYMQATVGPCRTTRPSVWHYSSRIKWDAWNDLGNMPRELAMEKYIEELTKVIETMSYNENVSKFMSLMGPFYEVVPSDEIEAQQERRVNKKKPSEFPYPIKNLDDALTGKKDLSSSVTCDHSRCSSKEFDFCADSPCKKSSKMDKNDASETVNRRYIPKRNVINMFKAKGNPKRQPFGSQQDILILTLINLQNSLEEIVKKFDHLQTLAKSADFQVEIKKEEDTSKEWDLGYKGTAFALLWPIAVYLCSRSF